MNPYIFALFTAASSLSDPTRAVDLDRNGFVTRCERLSVAAFDAYQAAVDAGMLEEQDGADAWAERALDECYVEAPPIAASLEAIGYFGATTFDRALEVSRGCGTPTAWVEAAGKGFVAVCGDDEGRPLSFRGAL